MCVSDMYGIEVVHSLQVLKEYFDSKWKPLRNKKNEKDEKVLIWDYDKKEPTPVIYRFILKNPNKSAQYIVYVGSGDNLSGKGKSKKRSLVYQYKRGKRAERDPRKTIEIYP